MVVTRGESACAIAGRYGVAASAVRRANGGSFGQTLVPGTSVRVGSEPLRHQIAPGETLAGLARWYGLSVETLAWANGLDNPNRIAAGSWLRVPPGARTGCPPPTLVARQPGGEPDFAPLPLPAADRVPESESKPVARAAVAAPVAPAPLPAIQPRTQSAAVARIETPPKSEQSVQPVLTPPPAVAVRLVPAIEPAALATKPVPTPQTEPIPEVARKPEPSTRQALAVRRAPEARPALATLPAPPARPAVAVKPAAAVRPALAAQPPPAPPRVSRPRPEPEQEVSHKEARRMLARAQSRYDAADFGAALDLATSSLRLLEPHRGAPEADRLRARANWISGLVYTGLGQSPSAVAAFRTALALDPSLADPAASMSPKVRTLVDLAGVPSVDGSP
jgi:LysM repeat protein